MKTYNCITFRSFADAHIKNDLQTCINKSLGNRQCGCQVISVTKDGSGQCIDLQHNAMCIGAGGR